jgi:ribosomal protein S18 acetylase RimI-like enzyme
VAKKRKEPRQDELLAEQIVNGVLGTSTVERDDNSRPGMVDALLDPGNSSAPRRPGFALIAAYDAGVLVGFGYAFPCTPAYWFGTELLPSIPEPARSTEHLVGLCELAVRPAWQDQGIGSRLHQALVDALAPLYIRLLAMPGNTDSQRLYRRLGYTYAGPYRNTPDGAVFDLLLLEVPADSQP